MNLKVGIVLLAACALVFFGGLYLMLNNPADAAVHDRYFYRGDIVRKTQSDGVTCYVLKRGTKAVGISCFSQ